MIFSSYFGEVPNEIVLKIIRYLSDNEVNNLRLLCRFFRDFIDSGIVWRLRISPDLLERGFRLHSRFCKFCNDVTKQEPCVWKQIYTFAFNFVKKFTLGERCS